MSTFWRKKVKRDITIDENQNKIFDIDSEIHEDLTQISEKSKPPNVLLHVRVIEAADVKAMDPNGFSDPYCILSTISPLSKSQSLERICGCPIGERCQHRHHSPIKQHSPKTSPGSSPLLHRSSPKLKKKIGKDDTFECIDVKQTRVVNKSLNPKWNEVFEMQVNDLSTDELHIHVWDCDAESTLLQSLRQLEKPSGLKSLFRHIRHNMDYGKTVDDFIGQLSIPLRDIPATGYRSWYNVYDRLGAKAKITGIVHLDLKFIVLQEDSPDGQLPSQRASVEDFYKVLQKLMSYSAKQSQDENDVPTPVTGELSKQATKIRDQFAIYNQISPITQALLKLSILLEWSIDHEKWLVIDATIRTAMNDVTIAMQNDYEADEVSYSQFEIDLFENAANKYASHSIKHIGDIPPIFPPSFTSMATIRDKFELMIYLLNLNPWKDACEPHSKKQLQSIFLDRLKQDVDVWITSKLDSMNSLVKDSVVSEMSTLAEIVSETIQFCEVITSYKHFFSDIGIDYYKTISFGLEMKISEKARELMLHLNTYQIRYQKYSVNIAESSKVSLKLYFALRNLYGVIHQNVGDREVFKLKLIRYQCWFEDALIFWLQTFRTECNKRLEKALEIDRDFVPVTSLVKHSNSCVDVKANFAKITSEWREISVIDADRNLMAITKITDTICDGARAYTDKISSILEKKGFYGKNNEQFDVTDQLCITLNNIEHIRNYLGEIRHLLEWDKVIEAMEIKHESKAIAQQAETTLCKLIATTNADLVMKSGIILEKIVKHMSDDIRRFTEPFTGTKSEQQHMNDLLEYLESNLSTFADRLCPTIIPRVLRRIWNEVLKAMENSLLNGQLPEYYIKMQERLKTLKSFFQYSTEEDEDNDPMLETPEYQHLLQILIQHSLPTEQLILQYYQTLANNIVTPLDYFGHIALKVAFMEETHGQATVFVKVLNATNLPGLDSSGLSDPFVTIELCPNFLFPDVAEQKTVVVEQCLRPVFNKTFHFPAVDREKLFTAGTVLHITVMDHDTFKRDDLAGETFISLATLPELKMGQDLESQQVVIISLKRPVDGDPSYQILKDRTHWDGVAKKFVKKRQKLIDNKPSRTDQPKIRKNSDPTCDASGIFCFLPIHLEKNSKMCNESRKCKSSISTFSFFDKHTEQKEQKDSSLLSVTGILSLFGENKDKSTVTNNS